MSSGIHAIRFNGQAMDVRDGTSVAQLLVEVGMRGKLVAVEVNLEIVPKEKRDQRLLRDGDEVEAVTLVGGG